MTETNTVVHTTSQGHVASDVAHLDRHYAMCQPEYEAMLNSVGLVPGWHVLDAGCGVGSFQPLMSQILGQKGRMSAIELAPENVEIAESRAASGQLQCPLEVRAGSVVKLPYPNDTFDAVWCAAVTQYLTDDELEETLSEFRRVTRPGGIVAIKDWDVPSSNFRPFGPRLMWHIYEALCQAGDTWFRQLFRNYDLPTWLRRAGLVDIGRRTILVERYQPLKPADTAFLKNVFETFSTRAQKCDLPAGDLAIWQQLGNVDSLESVLNDTDFYYREGHVLATGRVPDK